MVEKLVDQKPEAKFGVSVDAFQTVIVDAKYQADAVEAGETTYDSILVIETAQHPTANGEYLREAEFGNATFSGSPEDDDVEEGDIMLDALDNRHTQVTAYLKSYYRSILLRLTNPSNFKLPQSFSIHSTCNL